MICGLAVNETFDTSTLPAGWSIYDGDGYLAPDGYTWEWSDVTPPPGGSGGYWWVNSDILPERSFYERLYTAWYDGTNCDTTILEFDHRYSYWDGDIGYVLMTPDGTTWYILDSYSVTTEGHVTLDLHPELWTADTSQVKWLYDAYWAFYWRIGDVEMSGTP